jgi:hypothetical protein
MSANDNLPSLAAAVPSLAAAVGATYAAVLEELTVGTVESEYRAIARLSVHLAAMRRAVYSPRRHHAGPPEDLSTACCRTGRRLEWALWDLQGRLSGEIVAVRQSTDGIYAHLSQCLDGYLPADRALAAWVDGHLPADDCRRLAEAYLSCIARAPSRPHPRSPQGAGGYRIAFTFHRRWDRLLDTVDGRPGVGRGFLGAADVRPEPRSWPGTRRRAAA